MHGAPTPRFSKGRLENLGNMTKNEFYELK